MQDDEDDVSERFLREAHRSLTLQGATVILGQQNTFSVTLKDSEQFFRRVGENRVYERAVAVSLAFLVSKYEILRKDLQAALLAPSLLVFYVHGWVLLSLAGGFPATLFGLGIILLIPVTSYLYLRPVGNQSARLALSERLKQAS